MTHRASERNPDLSLRRSVGLGVHVALHEPEIPNNTGAIGRACVAMGCPLHLIHPLGFDLDEKALRRAGLDYWPRLDLREHADFEGFIKARPHPDPKIWLMTTKADRTLYDVDIRVGDALVFGKESAGLPEALLEEHNDRCVAIPMMPGERSLNLSCTAVAAMSEALRQAIRRGDRTLDSRARIVPPTQED